jgi:hypothetical protein
MQTPCPARKPAARQQLVLFGFYRRQDNSVAPAPLARGYIRFH